MVEEFRARRELMVDGLNAIPGVHCLWPHGAFYVFPDVAGTGLTGTELADRLLEDAGVCVLSGTRLRAGRPRPSPRQLRQLAREHRRGARADAPTSVAGLPAARSPR